MQLIVLTICVPPLVSFHGRPIVYHLEADSVVARLPGDLLVSAISPNFIVIGAFLSAGLITSFAIAGNLMNYSRALISGISTTMTPRASALEASGGPGEVQKLFLKAVRFATLVIMPVSLTFLLRGSSFIRLWMGQQYGEQSGRVLWILALALMFIASDQVAISTMLGIGKQKLLAFVVLGEAICNLALSIALVRAPGDIRRRLGNGPA